MGMLDRYKKTGGLVQLLKLIESFNSTKKEKFLAMIEAEDPKWAEALRLKLIQFDRIFLWPDWVLELIVRQAKDLTLANAIKGLSDEKAAKLKGVMPDKQWNRVELLLPENTFNPQESGAAQITLIEIARDLVVQGYIRFEKFDEDLHIDDLYEEKLIAGEVGGAVSGSYSAPSAVADMPLAPAQDDDMKKVQQMLKNLANENQNLKKENQVLRDKLDQIRKIA